MPLVKLGDTLLVDSESIVGVYVANHGSMSEQVVIDVFGDNTYYSDWPFSKIVHVLEMANL